MPSAKGILQGVAGAYRKTKRAFQHPIAGRLGTAANALSALAIGAETFLDSYDRTAPLSLVASTPKGRKLKNKALILSGFLSGGKAAAGYQGAKYGAMIGGRVHPFLALPAGIVGGALGYTAAEIAEEPFTQMKEAQEEEKEQRLRFIKEFGMTPEEARKQYEKKRKKRRRK